MEAYVVITIMTVKKAGEKMFPGMILHMVVPSLPVDLTSHSSAYGQRCLCLMHHMTILLMHLQDLHPA